MPQASTTDSLDTVVLVANLEGDRLDGPAARGTARERNGAFRMAFADTATKSDIAALKSELLTEIRAIDAEWRTAPPGTVLQWLLGLSALIGTIGGIALYAIKVVLGR